MKIERLFIYCLLATTCLFTACDNEVTADGDGVCTPLPEGMYPLTLTATQTGDEVQTRVSENSDGTSSAWTNGDQIKVKITGNNNEAETTCTLNASGQVTAYNPKFFWKTNGTSTVTAWYPTTGTVNLADQSSGLKYVLKATAAGASYKSSVALPFAHQLAKVRVKLTGEKASEVTSVGIKGFTSCTVTDGNVTGSGDGYISMRKHTNNNDAYWEANLVPQSVNGTGLIQLNGNKAVDVAGISQWNAGNYHTLTITVDKKIPTPDDLPGTVTSGEYTISGTGTKTIHINGNPTIHFQNVNLEAETAINIIGGNPKLVFEGNTTLKSTGAQNGAISLSGNANVEISGSGTLTLNASHPNVNATYGAVLGSAPNQTGGNISISNITLNIAANIRTAAIGSGSEDSSCGNIIIKDATIKIIGCSGGAGIGTSAGYSGNSSCGDIRITNSGITIEYGNFYAYQGSAIGCGCKWDGDSTVKGIYITLKPGQSKESFLENLKTTSATGSDKVGQGYNGSKVGTITDGIHWYNSDGNPIQ